MTNIGAVVSDTESVATTAAMTIQPPSGEEWQINNIYHEAEVELKIVNAANEVIFETSGTQGGWLKYAFNLTNTQYLKVYNTNAASKLIAYDGRRTA